jgi:hypothetical protein
MSRSKGPAAKASERDAFIWQHGEESRALRHVLNALIGGGDITLDFAQEVIAAFQVHAPAWTSGGDASASVKASQDITVNCFWTDWRIELPCCTVTVAQSKLYFECLLIQVKASE